MHLLNLIQLCFSILTLEVHGYVLLAANLDDFRSIAKRFVPGKLAEQLVEMASESTPQKETKITASEEIYYAETEEKSVESYEITEPVENQKQNDVKKPVQDVKELKKSFEVVKQPDERTAQADDTVNQRVSVAKEVTNINIDDIVEKVKARLEKEYILKLNNAEKIGKPKVVDVKTTQKYDINKSESEDYEYDETKPPVTVIDSTQYIGGERYKETAYRYTTQYSDIIAREPDRIKTTKKQAHKTTANDYENDEQQGHSEETVYVQNTEKNTMLFDAVDMLKSNDSYEDYVTPKKYEIFESKETSPTRYNVKAKPEKVNKMSIPKWPNVKPKTTTDYDYETDTTPGEIKARTENLMFEEKDIHREEIKNVTVKGSKGVTTKKVKSGTMIPTRQYFRISSPNYYAKLPIIAEKYDFNEPIPERDREREDLRSIGNPPASINKKVKLL